MKVTELPASLVDNPRLDQWVAFPSTGRIFVRTGKVEIGQGVLTAMLQIAAEELDVGTARITLQSGDTEFAPNEGYTSGSQSIQVGGLALRLACAEVRLLFLERAAQKCRQYRMERKRTRQPIPGGGAVAAATALDRSPDWA